MRLNHPETPEGWQVWDLVLRLTGQLRVAGSMGATVIIGWDMTAALAMAQALGTEPLMVAECLPAIEAVMVRKLNEQMAAERG